MVSNHGIDISGVCVANILVPIIKGVKTMANDGVNADGISSCMVLDQVWRAAEVAQKKRTDGKAVQG